MKFKEWLNEKDVEFLSEMERRDFLKALGGIAASGLAGMAKGSSGIDWKEKGYKDVTYDKKWAGPITNAYEDHKQRANYDDLLNNVHYWLVTNSDVKTKRNDLVPGKDFKIYEVIPSTFIEKYCAPNPSKFKKDYEKFKKLPEIEGSKSNYGLLSAQEPENFERPVIVLFLNSTLNTTTGVGSWNQKTPVGGFVAVFRPMKYVPETDKYKRNELYKGRTLMGGLSVVLSYPNLKNLDIENMSSELKKTLAHELRHTTQTSYNHHIVAKRFSDLTGVDDRYLSNSMEFGVRVAAMKDVMDISDLQRVFDSAVRKLVYKTGDKLSVPQKMLLATKIQKNFKEWQNGKEVEKALDLLDMHSFANKLGWSAARYDDPNTEEDDPLKTIPGKEQFQNEIITQFLKDFYAQDRQINHVKAVMDSPATSNTSDVDGGVLDIANELYDNSPKRHPQYREAVKNYIRNNWNYIVQKSYHKELGIST